MALQRTVQRWAAADDLIRALLLIAVAIAFMLVMTLIFGVHAAGPPYEIVPDPAGGLLLF